MFNSKFYSTVLLVTTLIMVSPAFAVELDCGSTPQANWRPNYGSVKTWDRGTANLGVNYSPVRKGAILQHLYWNNYQSRKFFSDNKWATFEPDFRTYDYSAKGWLNLLDSSSRGWSTSLPSPYLDTRFSDEPGEPSFTVGSAFAHGIEDGRSYYTYMQGYGRTSYTPSVGYPHNTTKLIYAVGKRSPSWCYSTWCSYGCRAAASQVKAIEFQDGHVAPGCSVTRYTPFSGDPISRC